MYISPLTISRKFYCTLVAAALGRRNTGRDQRPFLVGQIGWIAQAATVIAGAVFGCPHRSRLSQNQAASLESQTIHPIQQLLGQTLRRFHSPAFMSHDVANCSPLVSM